MFALSATSVSSSLSYELMRNTIKRFIDRYGVNNIHYSIIVYGNQVVRVVNFNRTFPLSANELKIAIDKQPALSGGPVLINALQEAYRVFKESVGRPGAKKVLVVMTDKNSGSRPNFLSQAVRPLEDLGVLVISVGVGDGVSRSELSIISPNPLDVISARLSINPSVLAVRIMERILKRKSFRSAIIRNTVLILLLLLVLLYTCKSKMSSLSLVTINLTCSSWVLCRKF